MGEGCVMLGVNVDCVSEGCVTNHGCEAMRGGVCEG